MYPVSKEFQEAIRQPYRKERVRGLLWLFDSNEQFDTGYQFTEDAIVQGSLTITDQLANGKFGYGGAYIRNLRIKLDTDKISNLNPININLTNARIFLWYYLTLDDGTEESVPLWLFYVNSKESSRKSNILSIVAEDAMTKFDMMSVGMSSVTPYEIYSKACELAGVGEATTAAEFANFPNGGMVLSFDTTQIETARDMLMWVAKLTGTIARVKIGDVDNNDETVELVQIPTKYTKNGTSGNFDLDAFKADNGTIIPPDIRFQTNFTDTSIRITTITMNRRDENIVHHNNWTFAPDTLEGTMEIENNPLLKNSDSSTANSAIEALADYTDDLRFCPSTVSFNGNPAIQVGDFVFLEKGGGIDDTKYRHYMIVTYSKWVYGSKHEIRCATDAAAERPKPKSQNTRSNEPMMLATNSGVSTLAETEGSRVVAPKSQLEKATRGVDARTYDRITDNQNVEVVAKRLDFGDLVFHKNNGISFYPKSNTEKYPPRPSNLERYTLPYAEIGVSSFSDDAVLRITQFTGYDSVVSTSIPVPLMRTLSFKADTITYTAGGKTFDLTQGSGGVEKEYVDTQDESYFEQSKEYTNSAVNTVADSVTQLGNSLTTTNNKVQTNTTDIAELRGDLNELQSEYGYTTKIAFKTGGFALTFADKDGNEFVNNFSVTESGGKITKITNVTAGKEIMITYE